MTGQKQRNRNVHGRKMISLTKKIKIGTMFEWLLKVNRKKHSN